MVNGKQSIENNGNESAGGSHYSHCGALLSLTKAVYEALSGSSLISYYILIIACVSPPFMT
jgi:hypothetical protein